MTDCDKLEEQRQMARSNYYAQLTMMGYGSDGNLLDMVHVVHCSDCRHRGSNKICVKLLVGTKDSFFCAFGERRGE